jgi:hypothetical protein
VKAGAIARKPREGHDQNDLEPDVRRHDLRYRHHLPALRCNFQPHRRRPGRDCHNACDRGFVRYPPALLVNPGGMHSSWVPACRVSSSIRPRGASSPVRRVEAEAEATRPFRASSSATFPAGRETRPKWLAWLGVEATASHTENPSQTTLGKCPEMLEAASHSQTIP